MYFTLLNSLSVLLFVLNVAAESHTIHFNNQCGFGVPTLVQAGNILSTGADYTNDGPINSAIAYLNFNSTPGTGMGCGINGDDCLLLELNMNNPACPGCGSAADISLIPDHKYTFPGGFMFYGGDGTCNGGGAFCASADCDTAFFNPNDNGVQRACQSDNVNLMITFCGPQQTGFTDAVANSAVDLGTAASSPSPSSTTPTTSSSSSAVASSSSSIAVVPVKASSIAAVPSSSLPPIAVANPSPSPASNGTASAVPSSSSGRCKRSLKRSKIEADISTGRLAHTRSRARARKF